jgi:hypothetical protein
MTGRRLREGVELWWLVFQRGGLTFKRGFDRGKTSLCDRKAVAKCKVRGAGTSNAKWISESALLI